MTTIVIRKCRRCGKSFSQITSGDGRKYCSSKCRYGLKAYLTELDGKRCIVAATSAAKARYATYRSAKAAGWDVCITRVSCKRASENDLWANSKGVLPNNCYSPEIATLWRKRQDESI